MKKFKFRYESVLKMRMDKEDSLKHELAKLIQKRQGILDDIATMESRREEFFMWIQETMQSGKQRIDFKQIDQGKRYYREHLEKLHFDLKRIDMEVEQAKVVLVEAMKERKAMEKLKEKEFQNYIEEYNKADMKLIEEVVNYKNNKTSGDE